MELIVDILYPGAFLLAGSLSLIFPHIMHIKQICYSGSSQNACHASTAHYSTFDSSALKDTDMLVKSALMRLDEKSI